VVRCQHLADHHKRARSRRHDDEWTRAGLRFLNALRRCRNEVARQRLAHREPAIHQAYSVHTDESPMRRHELEARLLAKESTETIAVKVGCTPQAVLAYQHLFFDVIGALHARSYILHVVIGPKVHDGTLKETDVDVLLKLYGYCHGGLMLDTLVDYFVHPPSLPERLEDLDSAALERLRDKLAIRTMLRIRTASSKSLATRLPRFIEIEKLLGKGSNSAEPKPGDILRIWEVLAEDDVDAEKDAAEAEAA